MHALILSCNTGGGHHSAGDAILECLIENGHTGEHLDFLALAKKNTSDIVSKGYVGVVKKIPAFFGFTYGLGRIVSNAGHLFGTRSPVYLACIKLIPAMEKYLKEHPCDVIIAPHMFAAMALTEMKKRNMLQQLTVAVATDYTAVPFCEEGTCDFGVIPSSLCIDDFVRRGFDRSKLLPFGIPVSAEFQHGLGKMESRRLLGMEEEGKFVLIAGGSMGAGHIKRLTKCLLKLTKHEVGIIAICGTNDKLYQRMSKKYCNEACVKVIGFTDKMARYMEACDLMYTKPGGISSTEGAVAQIPIVHMKPIPGCETKNREFFMKQGMSISARGVRKQAKTGWKLLGDYNKCNQMKEAQKRQITSDSAKQIVAFLEEKLKRGEK